MKNIKTHEIKKVISLLTVILISTLFLTTNVQAGAPVAPVFTVPPAESDDPIAEGLDVTFSATATEGNGNGWWLAICQSEELTGGAPPSCPGGAYCISDSFSATGDPNSCAWTTSGIAEHIWYGFACNEDGGRCTVNSNDNSPLTVEAGVDNTNPDISIIYPSNNTNHSVNTVDVNFTRSDANLAYCWYSNDTYTTNSTPDSGCDNITSVVWTEGQHNVTVWANDTTGNLNWSSVSFTIDTVNPDINITFPINNTNWTNVNLDVNFTRSDANLFNCWYSNDTYLVNKTLDSDCKNVTTVVWSEGQHNVTIWANDTVGNINSSKISFRIDTTLPVVDSIVPNPASIVEADVGEDAFTVTIDFSETMDQGTAPTITFDPDVSSTLTNCDAGTWTDSNTYVRTCDIADADVQSADIDIDVSGAKDLAGNTMDADTTSGENVLDIDTVTSDTCTCPGDGNNWEVDMSDFCELDTACNLGIGTLSFIGVGYANCSANINTTNLGDPGSTGILYVSSGCLIYVS